MGHGLIVDDENAEKPPATINQGNSHKTYKVGTLVQRLHFIEYFVKFAKCSFQNFILNDCNKLSEVINLKIIFKTNHYNFHQSILNFQIHNTLLQQFILSSFDMARKMQVIPTRIKYVAETEQQLYDVIPR